MVVEGAKGRPPDCEDCRKRIVLYNYVENKLMAVPEIQYHR
jgi:hypothetical protein